MNNIFYYEQPNFFTKLMTISQQYVQYIQSLFYRTNVICKTIYATQYMQDNIYNTIYARQYSIKILFLQTNNLNKLSTY